MKRTVCTIYLLFILVSGCTTPKPDSELDWFETMKCTLKSASKSAWYNPTKTLEECEEDFAECKRSADESIYAPFGSVFLEMSERIDFCDTCMQSIGYTLTPLAQLPAGIRRTQTPYGGWDVAGK